MFSEILYICRVETADPQTLYRLIYYMLFIFQMKLLYFDIDTYIIFCLNKYVCRDNSMLIQRDKDIYICIFLIFKAMRYFL